MSKKLLIEIARILNESNAFECHFWEYRGQLVSLVAQRSGYEYYTWTHPDALLRFVHGRS